MSDFERGKTFGRIIILPSELSVDYCHATVYTDATEEYVGGGIVTTEAAKVAKIKYDSANTVQLKFKLNRKTDADILEQLNRVGNKQGYVKALIRADLKENAGR